MDVNSAIQRISDLENRVRELHEERANYLIMLTNYQAFVDKIPKESPDGVKIENAHDWLRWAKKQLGYND